MDVSRSDTVQFDIDGHIFDVAVPNLRLSMFPHSVLGRAVLMTRDSVGEGPLSISGNPDLFPYILDMHRQSRRCRIPSTVSKAAFMQEARAFGLPVSAESIVQEGDKFRDEEFAHDDQSCAAGNHVRTWTVEQVSDWLMSLQQGRFALYVEKLKAHNVDGSVLAALTQEALKTMGVSDPKTRVALLAAVSAERHLDASACLAVRPESERESSPGLEEGEEAAKPVNAAALVLKTIFGENGTPVLFREMIATWRSEHSAPSTDATAVSDGTATGQRLGDKSTDRRVSNGILVAARVRPMLTEGPDAAALEVGDFESVSVPSTNEGIMVHLCGMQRDGKTPKLENKLFRVHIALGATHNEQKVFESAAPLVDTAVKYSTHTTIMCYGQTGSGKTHTVGHLAWRIARYLYDVHSAKFVVLEAFELKGGAKGLVSHTSNVFSLHADDKPELPLFEGEDGAVHVGGSNGVVGKQGQPLNLAHCALASNPEELVLLFRDAERRRTSRDTDRNAASSRSHAFYRFYLAEAVRPDILELPEVCSSGACIELVDLAGSESNKDSLYHDKLQIDERAKINSSLGALNTCIQKSVQGAAYVPFRADKLTQILRPCFVKRQSELNGVATVLFLACLSPLASDAQQSVRTLTYTEELTGMKGKATRTSQQNKFMGPGLKRLAEAAEKRDITELRAAICAAQRDGITGPERLRAMKVLKALEVQATVEDAEKAEESVNQPCGDQSI